MKFTLIAFLAAAQLASAALPIAIKLDSGPVEGVPSLVPGVMAFEGIPYAAPPVGPLRWKAPQPPEPWPVVRNADRYPSACPQNYMGPTSTAFFGDYEVKSEDCLYMNVWTPAKSQTDKLPVLVWIHGGGFRVGSGAERLHHGDHLAAKGVVLVTFNYRLGVFGFMAHPELTRESGHNASGNYGLMDQVAALQWVKRNAAAFGGDPNRITIFGESAGSGSVSYMQATPLAKGLFQGAIGESGGQFSGRGITRLAEAEANGVKFAASIGAKSLAELRKMSTDDVFNGIPTTPGGTAAGAIAMGPIVDGYVVPEDVYLIFAKGQQNKVPVLVGSNADEGTTLRGRPPELDNDAEKAEFAKLYPAGQEEKVTSGGMLWTMFTWAKMATATGNKAYQYYFSHHPPFPKDGVFQRDVTTVGAHHSAEIIYVFDNLDIRKSRGWPYTEWDRKLADQMSTYWVNFATTGDPNGKGLPKWPVFDPKNPQVINFGDNIVTMPLPRKAEVDFFDKVNLKPYKK